MFKMRPAPFKRQNLSPKAAADKAERDLAFAKTPARRAKKAENQRKRNEAEKNGRDLAGMDYDHKDGEFKSVAANRGNEGKGTKQEGKSNYNVA